MNSLTKLVSTIGLAGSIAAGNPADVLAQDVKIISMRVLDIPDNCLQIGINIDKNIHLSCIISENPNARIYYYGARKIPVSSDPEKIQQALQNVTTIDFSSQPEEESIGDQVTNTQVIPKNDFPYNCFRYGALNFDIPDWQKKAKGKITMVCNPDVDMGVYSIGKTCYIGKFEVGLSIGFKVIDIMTREGYYQSCEFEINEH